MKRIYIDEARNIPRGAVEMILAAMNADKGGKHFTVQMPRRHGMSKSGAAFLRFYEEAEKNQEQR